MIMIVCYRFQPYKTFHLGICWSRKLDDIHNLNDLSYIWRRNIYWLRSTVIGARLALGSHIKVKGQKGLVDLGNTLN